MTDLTDAAVGHWTGTGRWHGSEAIGLFYRHVFTEEDTPEVNAAFRFLFEAPQTLAFTIPGLGVPGRGFVAATILRFTIPIPGNHVQATHILMPDGTLGVTGSSEKNAAGRYVMWEERLIRT